MKKLLLTVICLFLVVFTTACSSNQTTEKSKDNSTNNSNQTSDMNEKNINEQPDPNTSSMVDYLIRQGKYKVDEATEEELNKALEFIKNNIDNLFADNETMEKTIYYGSLLEYYYAIDHDSYKGFNDIRGEIGMDAVQAVKYVYRNTETPNDEHVTENIRQIKENRAKL